jgi:hypothetical protein
LLIESAVDNFNDMKILFPTPFKIDAKKMAKYSEEQAQEEKELGMQKAQGKPGGKQKGFGGGAFGNSGGTGVRADTDEAVIDYLSEIEQRRNRSDRAVMMNKTQ